MKVFYKVLLLMGVALGFDCLASEPVQIAPAQLAQYWKSDKPLAPPYTQLALMTQLEGCYVVGYRIDESGAVQDAHVSYSDVSIKKSWLGLKGSQIARLKKGAIDAQTKAILETVGGMSYIPASENTAKMPVITRTLPVVLAILSLDRPDDEKAVAVARAAHERRRQEIFDQCNAAVEAGQVR